MIVFTISISLLFGFAFGIVYSTWMMWRRTKKAQDRIFEKCSKARCLMPRYQHAVTVAAQCWCDPRLMNIEMDTRLGQIFAKKISEYIEALQWCSGSDDFGPGGKAYIGFEKICRPLMDHKINISKLSMIQYKNLRENAPELLGLKG